MNEQIQKNGLSLSLHPDKIIKTSDLEKKLLLEEISQLPAVESGTSVALDGIFTVKYEDFLQVGFYIRNYLDRAIIFGNLTLKVMNNSEEVLASQVFRLVEMGQIPPRSVRPWQVHFNNENIFAEDIHQHKWKLAIEEDINQVYLPKIEDTLPKPLSSEELEKLKDFIRRDAPLAAGELRVIPYDIKQQIEGTLQVSLLIRSNVEKSLLWQEFGITVIDASGQAMAHGFFDIGRNIIEAGTFFFRTFTFPPDTVLINNADISNWTIRLL
ncbi:SLAP domain-containing protein [Desulfotomaculum sp. 1211_IL3151]|uniref:SLAP domain-containing protein n=1 Tax=Desulfotomaculum sp. 1211_IL3151 TaxID=3084055 RepID=UPI002FD897E8